MTHLEALIEYLYDCDIDPSSYILTYYNLQDNTQFFGKFGNFLILTEAEEEDIIRDKASTELETFLFELEKLYTNGKLKIDLTYFIDESALEEEIFQRLLNEDFKLNNKFLLEVGEYRIYEL